MLFQTDTRSRITVRACTVAEDFVSLQHILVDVDDNVTVHMTTIVAAAINVTAQQSGVVINRAVIHLDEVSFLIAPFLGIPDELRLIFIPAQRGNGQILKVDFQTVLDVAVFCKVKLFCS